MRFVYTTTISTIHYSDFDFLPKFVKFSYPSYIIVIIKRNMCITSDLGFSFISKFLHNLKTNFEVLE